MTDLEFMNFVTSTIARHIDDVNYDSKKVKYPNAEINLEEHSEYVEILITPYISSKINLKGKKQVFGTVTFQIFTPRSIGSNRAITLANLLSECIQGKIINGIVFDELDLKILNHTLSQSQTTTSIHSFQVNANVDYTYMR